MKYTPPEHLIAELVALVRDGGTMSEELRTALDRALSDRIDGKARNLDIALGFQGDLGIDDAFVKYRRMARNLELYHAWLVHCYGNLSLLAYSIGRFLDDRWNNYLEHFDEPPDDLSPLEQSLFEAAKAGGGILPRSRGGIRKAMMDSQTLL